MRQSLVITRIATVLIVTTILTGASFAGDSPEAADLAAELRATEQAFAQTLADRDHEAFTSFLANETVFFGQGEIRGKDAVAAAWKPFFEGTAAPFSWQPEFVSVLDSGTLGLSSGPIFIPDGTRAGTFNSVWRRQDDGTWKVVFDRGCPECECPPAEAAAPKPPARMPFLVVGKMPHLTGTIKQHWDDTELALMPGQKAVLLEIRKNTMSAVMGLAEKLDQLESSLAEQAMTATPPDKLAPLVDKISGLKTEATMVHLSCIQDTMEILDDRQLAALLEMSGKP
jgi:ketosteroid isomerase-like protein